jgi:hypothetical protein
MPVAEDTNRSVKQGLTCELFCEEVLANEILVSVTPEYKPMGAVSASARKISTCKTYHIGTMMADIPMQSGATIFHIIMYD